MRRTKQPCGSSFLGQPWRCTISAIAVASSICVAGCASIADDPTVPAFATAATAAKSAFETARAGEAEAFRGQALNQAANRGTIRISHCLVHEPELSEAELCKATLVVDNEPIDVNAVGPTLAAEADKLADYANDLKELAAAQDLADRQAALQKLAKSIGGVFSAAGIPAVEPVGDLIADLLHQSELNHRRLVLLRIAEEANPAVQALAGKLQTATTRLQSNIILARSQTVSDLETRFVTMPRDDPERRAVADELLNAAASEQSAAAVKFDLTAFGRAHQTMIASLENPKIDLKSAVAEISALADEVDQVKAALGPASRGTP